LEDNIYWLYLEYDLILLNKVIKSIYLIKGFNQFIKILDSLNGCISELDNPIEINIQSISNIIKNVCLEQFNISNYPVDISKFKPAGSAGEIA